MKENDKKKPDVLITEGAPTEAPETTGTAASAMERLKKPLIFTLMGFVFLGCMYLIFSPSGDSKIIQQAGLNDAVPQATDAALPADKGKAYEQEQLEQKAREKRDALTTLSDYWNTDSTTVKTDDSLKTGEKAVGRTQKANPALNSYRNIQSSLGSFYKGNGENESLQREVESLKKQLADKQQPPVDPIKNQLALMEKSYEMAAKYLPVSAKATDSVKNTTESDSEKGVFEAIHSEKKDVVSVLYRKPTDSTFMANWSQQRNREFYTSNSPQKAGQSGNSIRACVHETQTVTSESSVVLRLLETARLSDKIIPAGTHLIASAKFQGGRLQLRVVSMELEGSIIPLDISVYDLDGQRGLYVPYSPEMNAATEMASKMGTATGTSFTLNSSAGQQVAADLSKGVIQGVTGYFAKKVKTPKVTVKAGYQLFLVSKK